MKGKKVFHLGELFCGPGGLALGADMAKIQTKNADLSIESIWANDYDENACKTYKNNILSNDNKKRIICKDIRELSFKGLDNIDALAFGFPCNDFSQVGEQKGINGNYGPLYTYGIEAVRHFEPDWFVAENVSGLSSSNDGNTFDRILKDMFDSGYDVFPHLYKFEKYGVPQSRHRILIVGIKKELKLTYRIPAPTHEKPMTCRYAIETPPITNDLPNNELTKQSKTVVSRLKYIKPGENAFTAKMPDKLRLKVNGAKISQIYKRLDPNKPAYTVTGSGGGGTHVYHWEENRALTNRERARLQTFPDHYIFHGTKENVRKQIGMAVPPQGVKNIFEAILKTFAEIHYEHVESSFPALIHKEPANKINYSNNLSKNRRIRHESSQYVCV